MTRAIGPPAAGRRDGRSPRTEARCGGRSPATPVTPEPNRLWGSHQQTCAGDLVGAVDGEDCPAWRPSTSTSFAVSASARTTDAARGPHHRLGPTYGSGHAATPLRRPGAEPAPRLRGALAAGAGQGLTTRSARPVTRATRRSACCRGWTTRPCCTTAPAASTPLAHASGSSRQPGARRPAQPHLGDQRPDVRRAAQGLRASGPEHHPADLHDQLPPAPGGRPRATPSAWAPGDRPRVPWPEDAIVRLQLRGRVGQPLHGRRGAQRGRLPGAPQDRLPGPVRVRGQRHRHQHQVPGRVAGSRAAARCPGCRLPARGRRRSRHRCWPSSRSRWPPFARVVAPPCCTCAPSGSWATPARTPSSPTAPGARSWPTTRATPSSATAAGAARRAASCRRRRSSTATSDVRLDVMDEAKRVLDEDRLATAGGRDGAARPAHRSPTTRADDPAAARVEAWAGRLPEAGSADDAGAGDQRHARGPDGRPSRGAGLR